jgi:hypothetical protein
MGQWCYRYFSFVKLTVFLQCFILNDLNMTETIFFFVILGLLLSSALRIWRR